MSLQRNVLIWRILFIIILYTLQGFIQGFTKSIPLYLASYQASWKQQGTFSWVVYPFSFKILWAPIIDSVYSRRFGRHQTWLVPVQVLIGIILVSLSFYLESLLVHLHNIILTVVFFFIYLLVATQDIVVDGWTVLLFNAFNPQWSSTCQNIGQMTGAFIGSTILMTFESSNFTNKYIREPLLLPHRPYGLFSLQQFTFFFGVIFIVVSITIMIISLYKKQSNKKNNFNIQKETAIKLNIFETYLDVFKLFKKQCVRELALILLTFNIGFAATSSMTSLTLLGHGITRDTIALLNTPLIVIHIIMPLCLSGIRRPLIWFTRGYIPRLIVALILAIYIFFTPRILHTSYFYPVLLLFLGLNEVFGYWTSVTVVGSFARVSEPRIAGTYMTLLATITNLGASISSTLVLYIAEWLPKPHAYSIEVGICLVLGLIWIGLAWRLARRLDELPIENWYLEPSVPTPISSAASNTQTNTNEGVVNISSINA